MKGKEDGALEGARRMETQLYEKGKAMALQAGDKEEVPLLRMEAPGSFDCPQPGHQADFFRAGATAPDFNLDPPAACGSSDPVAGVDDTECHFSTKRCESADLVGMTLGSCGPKLQQHLLEVISLRSKSTGRRNSSAVFPLPTSRGKFADAFPDLSDVELTWMVLVCMGLNSLWGCEVFFDGSWTPGMLSCVEALKEDVRRFCLMDVTIPELDWTELFKIRSVDYKGDEVRVARKFGWKNISPALPGDVGNVPLSEVCTLGCRHYVLHFDQYLKPESEWELLRPPRVMVEEDNWPEVCRGLVHSRVCVFIEEDSVFHTSSGPLLNGLFGVTKEEFTPEGVEIFRLIMNLTPLNALCKPLAGDVDTLPCWSGMHPFFIQPSEGLLVSSEDVKCFFYTMGVPDTWVKFLAFNKLVPDEALPPDLQGKRVYLSSRVLPMGFLNSVSLAQHVHRNLVAWSGMDGDGEHQLVNEPMAELRKDRPMTQANPAWRVYLDNYDLLERVQKTQMIGLQGSCAPGVLSLRNEYEVWGVPRNVKKSVQRSAKCELQGATVDGELGLAFPREVKLAKYFQLALLLATGNRGTQKQWQVVCGGLVYVTMFRKQLLGTLNAVWRHIESFNSTGFVSQVTPLECRLEVLRFLSLFPLARMSFRLDMHEMVTCSDASTSGGGVCASVGLTPVGAMVSEGSLRGDFPEACRDLTVLCVGLFDGISALRVALDVLGVQVIGHISVEKHAPAQRVVEAQFPGVLLVDDVCAIDEAMVHDWSVRFSQCNLVLLGGGPPCQGVSGLNCDRRGALGDERSSLFVHVPRVRDLLRRNFPWCPVHYLMESVASMDKVDREIMSEAIQQRPIFCDAGALTWCHRPRLYWTSWEIPSDDNYMFETREDLQELVLRGSQPLEHVIKAGWQKVDQTRPFPTFTTSRPSLKPGRKPAGIQQCSLSELERWTFDSHRFPPYQYREQNCLVNRNGVFRIPDVSEREMMMGFPLHFTVPCTGKRERGTTLHNDLRLTLLGNSWSVPIVACLLQPLFSSLGFCREATPADIVQACLSGTQVTVQGRLFRLPLNPGKRCTVENAQQLASQLGNLISIKGEDILLSSSSSQMVKHHRLRASVPGRLWKWRIITGWKWTLGHEHINSLELRAVLTSLRWRVEHQKHRSCRLIHLVDSLVCLRALSRGRSSSRKLRRTMSRVNALLLASNIQPVWGYIHTDQNPADRPSRWGRRVKTKYRDAKKTPA